MAREYLIIFQHGPVQEFIATARRTDDFWAGSFLLSYVTAFVIDKIESKLAGEIIFPYPRNDSNISALEAAFPNRVAAIVEMEDHEKLKPILVEIQDSVRSALISIFEEVELAVTGEKVFAARQLGFFESFFVVSPYDGNQHGASFAEAQSKLEARKNIRNFPSSFEYGFKCTQCGSREPLRGNASSDVKNISMTSLRKYWHGLRTGEYRYSFKENEMLCSVCCGKRLLHHVRHPKEMGIPSTSAVAVAAWIDENSTLFDADSSREFIDLLGRTGLKWKCTPVFKNRIHKENGLRSRPMSSYVNSPSEGQAVRSILSVEGDFFFPDSYDRLSKEVENGMSGYLEKAKQILLQRLKKAKEALPPRYLAVVVFDADGMGDALRQVSSKDEHQKLTRELSNFATEVKRICHDVFHGHVIYVGGDEGVVLVPLSEMLLFMENLQKAFSDAMKGKLTLSAGAAVIHHQSPLGQGIRTAHETIHKAKAIRGKNAFAVTLLKRSGSRIHAISPWAAVIDGDETSLVEFLEKWLSLYRAGSLSPRWFYHVSECLPRVIDERDRTRSDIAEKLFFRTLPRHMGNTKTALALVSHTVNIMNVGRGLTDFNKLMALLYLPLYIFQGGDK